MDAYEEAGETRKTGSTDMKRIEASETISVCQVRPLGRNLATETPPPQGPTAPNWTHLYHISYSVNILVKGSLKV